MHSAKTVRQAIALREAGHTVREVATILDIPSSTIRTWGHRGFGAVLASSHRGRAWHGEQEQCPVLAELPVRSSAGRRYSYPRYTFSNRSEEIRALFTEACERLGIASRQMNVFAISVARRQSVEKMDRIIGPKS